MESFFAFILIFGCGFCVGMLVDYILDYITWLYLKN